MITKTKDFVIALLLLAATGVMYYESTHINMARIQALGPAFFPRMLLAIIAALSLMLLVQSVRLRPAPKAEKAARAPMNMELMANRWGLVALLFLYLVLLPVAGYAWSTIPFLLAGMALLGPRKPKNLAIYAIVSAAVTFGLQFIFTSLLSLILP